MLEGMFAIGVWDRQEEYLFLARDFAGISTIFQGIITKICFFFSSSKSI